MIDLNNKEELDDFHDDCSGAYLTCPNVRHYSSCIREMRYSRYPKTAKEIFEYWDNNDVLWGKGYYVHLSDESKELFRYIRNERDKVLDKYLAGEL